MKKLAKRLKNVVVNFSVNTEVNDDEEEFEQPVDMETAKKIVGFCFHWLKIPAGTKLTVKDCDEDSSYMGSPVGYSYDKKTDTHEIYLSGLRGVRDTFQMLASMICHLEQVVSGKAVSGEGGNNKIYRDITWKGKLWKRETIREFLDSNFNLNYSLLPWIVDARVKVVQMEYEFFNQEDGKTDDDFRMEIFKAKFPLDYHYYIQGIRNPHKKVVKSVADEAGLPFKPLETVDLKPKEERDEYKESLQDILVPLQADRFETVCR